MNAPTPPRLGVDLDGVVVDSMPRWFELLMERFGDRFRPDVYPETHRDPEVAAFCDAHEQEMLFDVGPVPGAAETLAAARAAGWEIHIVTARHPRIRRSTEDWLERYGVPYDDLHMVQGSPKGPVAARLGVGLFVEDHPYHVASVAETGIPVIVFDAPYNRSVRHPRVQRCTGWEEILHRIRAWPRAI